MRIVEGIEQGTPEWLKVRAGILTASRFGDVLAKGRGGKPSTTRQALIYKLATERLTGRTAEDGYSNYWMDRGKQLEGEARSLYEFTTGVDVHEVTFVLADDRIGCSPDGMVGDDGLVEIKCPKLATHCGYLLDGKLPAAYKPQVQGQMWVCERDWCDFVSYCPDSHQPMFLRRVERDEKYIKTLAEACADFLAELDQTTEELREAA